MTKLILEMMSEAFQVRIPPSSTGRYRKMWPMDWPQDDFVMNAEGCEESGEDRVLAALEAAQAVSFVKAETSKSGLCRLLRIYQLLAIIGYVALYMKTCI